MDTDLKIFHKSVTEKFKYCTSIAVIKRKIKEKLFRAPKCSFPFKLEQLPLTIFQRNK